MLAKDQTDKLAGRNGQYLAFIKCQTAASHVSHFDVKF